MKYNALSLRNIVLGIIAFVLAICIIASFFVTVEFSANNLDLVFYRVSMLSLLVPIELGVLLEMNLFNLKGKFPLIKNSSAFKHILFWFIVIFVAAIFFTIPYNMTSEDFRTQLNNNIVTNAGVNDLKFEETTNTIIATGGEFNDNQIFVPETNGSTADDNKIDMTETDKSNLDDDNLTWSILSKSSDRYKLALTLVGENLHTKAYTDKNFSELTLKEKRLVQDLFYYYDKYNSLPEDFTSTFTAFCVGKEFENMIIETYDNPLYSALSKSFIISWKSDNTYYIHVKESQNEDFQSINEAIIEENPLTFIFDNNENVVGNCSVNLRKIEIVNQMFAAYSGTASYSKFIRVHATVKNNSSQETYFSAQRTGSSFIGQYYGTNETITIGWNNHYKWKVDSDIKTDFGWTLAPNQSKEICVSGVFINEDELRYSDKPQLDLYFTNNGETLTLSVNK